MRGGRRWWRDERRDEVVEGGGRRGERWWRDERREEVVEDCGGGGRWNEGGVRGEDDYIKMIKMNMDHRIGFLINGWR